MKIQQLFVTGIGTGVGKTVVSAVLTEHLKADYWKPIQSGDLEQSDSLTVQNLASKEIRFHPEKFRLKLAASPHKSAKKENIKIHLNDFELPKTDNHLIVEGAGGLYVPLNDFTYMTDLIKKLKLPVVLVANDYLGCINHTLLSLESLSKQEIEVQYFVFNGDFDEDTESAIRNYLDSKIKIIQIPTIDNLTQENIQKISKQIHL